MAQPTNLFDKNGKELDFDNMDGIDLQDHSITEENPIPTKKPYLQLVAQNAAAIRDTANNEVTVDTSKVLGEKLIVVANTLNQSVTLTPYAKSGTYSYANFNGTKTIPAGNATVFSSADFGQLKGPIPQLTLRVAAAAAPTSGSISIYVEGVQA